MSSKYNIVGLEEFPELLKNGVIRNKDLSNIDFQKFNMNIENIKFVDCKFGKELDPKQGLGSFTGADFSNLNLYGCSFESCHLVDTNFSNVNLYGCSFESCDIRGADYSNVDLKNTIFNNCNDKNVKWSQITTKKSSNENVVLNNAKGKNNFSLLGNLLSNLLGDRDEVSERKGSKEKFDKINISVISKENIDIKHLHALEESSVNHVDVISQRRELQKSITPRRK